MSPIASNLNNLVDLARERTSQGRRDLLREITDLFFDAPADLNQTEVDLFGDVIGDLVREMEIEVRAGLSERLSQSPEAPANVIEMLANDEIEVARPVLGDSPVLCSEALIRIVKRRSQEHKLAISLRKHIDEATSEVLVEGGDDAVIEAIVKNPGAQLSRNAMTTVVRKSEHNKNLQRPLISRQDLPADLMHQMFWWVSNILRERILAMTDNIDQSILDEFFSDTQDMFDRDASGADDNCSPAQKFIRRKAALGQLNEALLVELLRSGQVPEFVVGFARLTELDIETARKIILDHGCEPLAITCKACSFDRSTFATIEMLTYNGPAREAREVFELLEVYDRVSVESARRAIRFWRVRMKAAGNDSYWPPRGTDYTKLDIPEAATAAG